MRYVTDILTPSDTIPSGETDSNGVTIGEESTLLGVVLPGTLTSTNYELQAKIGGSWVAIYDNSDSQVKITGANSGFHAFDPADVIGLGQVRLHGDGSGEGADRSITWVTGRLQ